MTKRRFSRFGNQNETRKKINSLDAELLLAHVLNASRTFLFAHPDYKLTPEQYQQYQSLLARAENGEPIAYIIGKKEFWSLDLVVTPDVLIPRPETELLVEKTLELIQNKRAVIADLGTGSGAIALALAHEKPDWQIYATDQSANALHIAENNAAALKIKNIAWCHGDWCAALPDIFFDAIVSNPPYISEADPHLASLAYEPRTALVSGVDGLQDIRRIVSAAPAFLKPGGWLLLEHGFDQGEAVKEILLAAGFSAVAGFCDLSGNSRVTAGSKVHDEDEGKIL